jgi:CBS-domain-containing membrane protein
MERPTPESVTQATTIGEADAILEMRPVIVREDDSLQRVAELAVQNTGCRAIAVVDADDRLVGVIPVGTLVKDIFLKIVPEEVLGEIDDIDAVLEYAAHLRARTAREIMREPASVHPGDTVRDAFARLHATDLIGLPIVDDERRVVGYVDQLELLLVWVRASGRQGLLEPKAGGS